MTGTLVALHPTMCKSHDPLEVKRGEIIKGILIKTSGVVYVYILGYNVRESIMEMCDVISGKRFWFVYYFSLEW